MDVRSIKGTAWRCRRRGTSVETGWIRYGRRFPPLPVTKTLQERVCHNEVFEKIERGVNSSFRCNAGSFGQSYWTCGTLEPRAAPVPEPTGIDALNELPSTMTTESRRRFLTKSLGLAAVATAGPLQLLAWLRPSALNAKGNGLVDCTYQITVSAFETFELGGVKIGLTEVGSSIKLTGYDELTMFDEHEMNPDHCKHSGVDGVSYPISVVRIKESGRSE